MGISIPKPTEAISPAAMTPMRYASNIGNFACRMTPVTACKHADFVYGQYLGCLRRLKRCCTDQTPMQFVVT